MLLISGAGVRNPVWALFARERPGATRLRGLSRGQHDILTHNMGSISVACYKPKPGCEEALLELVRHHLPPLRAEKLITDSVSIVMRAGDGTIIEVFEWVSQEAIAGAHSNPAVLDLWKRFEAVCTYVVPSTIAEFTKMFAHFEPI